MERYEFGKYLKYYNYIMILKEPVKSYQESISKILYKGRRGSLWESITKN